MRLEGDKDSLQLQVTVLSEQVEAQAEKIIDLENSLEEKREQLQKAEEQLQKVSLFVCAVMENYVQLVTTSVVNPKLSIPWLTLYLPSP